MMSFSKADFRRKSLWFSLDAATLLLMRSSSLSETKNLSCFARFRGIENGSFLSSFQRGLKGIKGGTPCKSHIVLHEVCTHVGILLLLRYIDHNMINDKSNTLYLR